MRSEPVLPEENALTCPDADIIRSHLNAVVSSREFAGSPRLCSFLGFVVENTLAGQADQIKESLIAVEVYGRRPDYNPQVDSTVRVEAGRLRARLRQYYEGSGAGDPLQIEIPKGSYAPVFRARQAEAVAPQPEMPPPSVSVPAPASERRAAGPIHALLAIVAVGVSAAVLSWSLTRDHDAPVDSVIVLPFHNLSEHEGTDRFCDGLTEDVMTGLARESGVRVPARLTMARYKEDAPDLLRIGREHGVRAVLEGTVRRDGERFVVTTRLIDTRNGYHLWADRYERVGESASSAQKEVSAKVVAGLREVLRDGTQRVTEAEVDAATLDLYHRAWELLRIPVNKNGPPEKLPDTVVEAVRLFQEVTTRSPRFAKGWAALAEAFEWEYELRGNQPAERLTQAKAAARRAVEVAPDSVEGWTILSSILFFREWNLEAAEEACRRVIELDPRNVRVRRRYIDLLRTQARWREAEWEIEQAIRLHPATAAFRVRRALMLYERGEYKKGLEEGEAAAALTNESPAYPMSLWVQGLCLEALGRYADAERIFRVSLIAHPHDHWSEPSLGHLLARTGRTEEAEAILGEMREQQLRGRLTFLGRAIVHTALGRTADALQELERGWAERADAVLVMLHDPRLRPLHSEPRFQRLLAMLATPRT